MFRLALVLSVLGCSSAAAPPPTPAPRPHEADPVAPRENERLAVPSAAAAPNLASASSETPLPFRFERVDPTPVRSFAVGKPPKVAALTAGEVIVYDGEKTLRVPAPETREPELVADVFFGRDDEPRLMGYSRLASGKSRQYYRRYRGGQLRPEPSELGPLAGADVLLYGVLGHDDPEVVCSPGRFCLVKSVAGWGRAAAHAEPVRMVLAGGTAFALGKERIERLERGAWLPLVPERAFDDAASLSVDSAGVVWVVEAKPERVSRLVNGRWETMASPVHGARAVRATSASDVWLVGGSGAAHFDGKTFRPVPDVSGPLAFIARSASTLWLAGEAGVFRSIATKKD